ncbi:hypothetical protein E4U33_006874, partial [Claviceps sp. LM78 group G4]
ETAEPLNWLLKKDAQFVKGDLEQVFPKTVNGIHHILNMIIIFIEFASLMIPRHIKMFEV